MYNICELKFLILIRRNSNKGIGSYINSKQTNNKKKINYIRNGYRIFHKKFVSPNMKKVWKHFLHPKSISHKFNTRHTLRSLFPLQHIFQNSVTNKSNQFNKIKNRTNISLLFSHRPLNNTHIYLKPFQFSNIIGE